MLDPAAIRAVTFDCYGTLIDWEAGIRAYVRPHLERAVGRTEVPPVTLDEWMVRWEQIQRALLVPWRPYRDVLTESFERTMRSFHLESFADGGPGLARSVADWAPFPDTVAALKRLARRRRLAIISNIDDALLAQTLAQLQAPFAALITAEQAREYKPGAAPFRLALDRLGFAPHEILHTAFGWSYDLETARSLGMRTCWVNRGDVTQPAGEPPDLVVACLTDLAEQLA